MIMSVMGSEYSHTFSFIMKFFILFIYSNLFYRFMPNYVLLRLTYFSYSSICCQKFHKYVFLQELIYWFLLYRRFYSAFLRIITIDKLFQELSSLGMLIHLRSSSYYLSLTIFLICLYILHSLEKIIFSEEMLLCD